MRLSELITYAAEKFNILEQKKWKDFSGFSVLADRGTNQWVALLIQKWSRETGRMTEFCDMKCGQENILKVSASYLSAPYRMRGRDWIGIQFQEATEREVVYRLFDQAVERNHQTGVTITLDNNFNIPESKYQDTPLHFEIGADGQESDIPAKIRDMRRLYRRGDGSLRQKAENFYRQGKFMEDYEDNAGWEGEFRHYFPTYQDLSLGQLRGYFAWRAEIRKGNYQRIATSLAYIYLYELLNGIGTASVEDSLHRMKEFETNYIDSGIGDSGIRQNLRRWMLELAVLNGIQPETARECADPEMLEQDEALAVLRAPAAHNEQETFKALDILSGHKLSASVVIKKHESEGASLFAKVWRVASARHQERGRNLFKECFGDLRAYRWYPLANAVFLDTKSPEPIVYALNACREYSFQDGEWNEKAYHQLHFNKSKFAGLIRAADRKLREYLKTGYFLRERSEEAWAAPYINAVIEADQRNKAEAAKPKVLIRFADLDQIRQDARETMDSLLSEEEKRVLAVETEDKESAGKIRQALEQETVNSGEKQALKGEMAAGGESADSADSGNADSDNAAKADRLNLNETEFQVLNLLLADKPVKALLAERHSLPEVVADRLNEAFFEEVGDTVAACEAGTITLVSEYREDVRRLMEGENYE